MRLLVSIKAISPFRSIFSGFQNLWSDFSDMVYAKVPDAFIPAVLAVHEQSKRDQFLMKLCPKFKATRLSLMN
jgi:hypothetical protein